MFNATTAASAMVEALLSADELSCMPKTFARASPSADADVVLAGSWAKREAVPLLPLAVFSLDGEMPADLVSLFFVLDDLLCHTHLPSAEQPASAPPSQVNC